jgi:hypothetical protein
MPEEQESPETFQSTDLPMESQTPDMEVHHHPRLDHKQKPWKEYLLEGLMIFVAVTLGFFAENLREHISDSRRETEFAKELYAEFKDDSVMAAHLLSIRIEKRGDIDYLYNYFRDSSLTSLSKNVYPAFSTSLYLFNTYSFEPKDGILSQLRSTGSLHYFKSVELQKLLGDISVCINNVRSRNEQEYQYFASPLKPFLLKFYDFSWLNKLRNGDNQSFLLDLINKYRRENRLIEGTILHVDSLDRKEFCNMLYFYKQMLISTESLQMNNYIVTNRKILQALRENYTLGNE